MIPTEQADKHIETLNQPPPMEYPIRWAHFNDTLTRMVYQLDESTALIQDNWRLTTDNWRLMSKVLTEDPACHIITLTRFTVVVGWHTVNRTVHESTKNIALWTFLVTWPMSAEAFKVGTSPQRHQGIMLGGLRMWCSYCSISFADIGHVTKNDVSKCEKNEGAILSQSIADIIVRLHIDFYNYYYLYLFGLLERFVVFSITFSAPNFCCSSEVTGKGTYRL